MTNPTITQKPDSAVCADEKNSINSKDREQAVTAFADLLQQLDYRPEDLPEQQLWELILSFEHEPFFTFKGLEFRYSIRGNEMFIDRKEKSITRSTIRMAAEKALEIRHRGEMVSGPKKLGTFGASYLYPIFQSFGLISRK
ncbi:MAG: hypothetical protein LIO75_06345 [Lachnospiraceae bacterium]|nr:hypothetical protein [Lachnospiraceae bacterium]